VRAAKSLKFKRSPMRAQDWIRLGPITCCPAALLRAEAAAWAMDINL
jgi:hypothetical protein